MIIESSGITKIIDTLQSINLSSDLSLDVVDNLSYSLLNTNALGIETATYSTLQINEKIFDSLQNIESYVSKIPNIFSPTPQLDQSNSITTNTSVSTSNLSETIASSIAEFTNSINSAITNSVNSNAESIANAVSNSNVESIANAVSNSNGVISSITSIIENLNSATLTQELVQESIERINSVLTTRAAEAMQILSTGDNVEIAKMSDELVEINEFTNALPNLILGLQEALDRIRADDSNSSLQDEENRRETNGLLERIADNTEPNAPSPLAQNGDSKTGIFGMILALGAKLFAPLRVFVLNLNKIIMYIPNAFKSVFVTFSKGINKIISWLPTSIRAKFTLIFDDIAKYFSNIISKISNSKFVKPLLDFFTKVKDFGTKLSSSIKGIIDSSKTVVKPFIEFIAKIKDMGLKMVSSIRGGTSSFKEIFKPVAAFFSKMKEVGKIIKEFLPNSLLSKFSSIGGTFSKFAKFGSALLKLGKLAGPIGIAISIITGIIGAVKGAIAGFQKEGILGAIKEGVVGLTDGLIGGLIRILADITGWLLDKLGFVKLGETFGDSISKMIEGIYDIFRGLFDMVVGIFTLDTDKISESFMKIVSALWENIMKPFWNIADGLGQDIASMLRIDDLFEWLGFTVAEIINSLTEKFNNSIDWVKDLFDGAIDILLSPFNFLVEVITSFSSEVAAAIENINMIFDKIVAKLKSVNPFGESEEEIENKKKAKAMGWNSYEEYEKSGWKEGPNKAKINTQSSTNVSNITNTNSVKNNWKESELYKTMPEETKQQFLAQEAGYKSWDEYKKANWAWKPNELKPVVKGNEITSVKSISTIPNTKGSILLESSKNSTQQPIIINQMGGNVSNTNVSSVNNTSAQYDAIMTGSSLGLNLQ